MFTNKNLFSNACKLVLCVVFLTSCERKAEFFIDGKGYYTKSRCLKDTTYSEWCYQYGVTYNGKMGYYWGFRTKNECLESVIDTIQVK